MMRYFPLGLMESVLNKIVRDSWHDSATLGELEGCVVRFKLTKPLYELDVSVSGGRFYLSAAEINSADAVVTGDVPDFLSLLKTENQAEIFLMSKMDVQGNLEILNRLAKFFGDMDIDWEEHLAMFVGDGAARSMMLATHSMRQWRLDTLDSLQSNARDYLEEEVRLVVTGSAVAGFCCDVDIFRNDVDRLYTRVCLLFGGQ